MLVNARKLFIIPLIFIGWNTVQAQEVLTLKQCIDTAQVYNKTLQINRNHISISEQREKEAKANLIPKVTANADYKYFMELPTQLMPMNALNPQAPEGQFRDIQLRPLGIDVKNEITAEDWFLNDASDVRSSHYLELVATEFDIQGLEIDYVCLAWDINFNFNNGAWNYQSFEGTKWKAINSEIAKSYLRNAYRVLMTRARQGLIIFIPYGENLDPTRPIELYDNTYNFLISCGIQTI